MEAKRAEKDEYLKGQNEVQRQLNDCITYKRNKQAEDDLGKRIDQLGVQIRDVSCSGMLSLSLHLRHTMTAAKTLHLRLGVGALLEETEHKLQEHMHDCSGQACDARP